MKALRVFGCGCLFIFVVMNTAEGQQFKFVYSYIQIHGTAEGGTVSIGSLGNPKSLITVATTKGQTEQQVAEAIAAKSLNQMIVLGDDGKSLKIFNSHAGCNFVRIADSGMQTMPGVSALTATPAKATNIVHLGWRLPNPAPAVIYIRRSNSKEFAIDGNSTSYDDSDFKAEDPTYYVTYNIVCGYKATEGTEPKDYFKMDDNEPVITKFSDFTGVRTKAPPALPNDKFEITTAQLSAGTNGAEYSYEIEKNGGTDPAIWTVDSGSVPGIVLKADGILSGTPTQCGQFNFIAKVTDATGKTATKSFTISVNALHEERQPKR